MADLQPSEVQLNGGTTAGPSMDTVATKRQRRPSVRLGDIGDQSTAPLSYDSLARRTKQWHDYKHKKEPFSATSGKTLKARNLVNLKPDFLETLDVAEMKDANCDGVAIGSWKVKDSKQTRRATSSKRIRSSWVSNLEEPGAEVGDDDDKLSGDEDLDEEFHRGRLSESPLKECNSEEREVQFHGRRRPFDALELEEPSDTDGREWKCGTSTDGGGEGRGGRFGREDGVRIWLDGLGLGRYAPVFEIHEVDGEALPMLTLEDLKDMGINAVGSRRKMFAAIQKLGKGFS